MPVRKVNGGYRWGNSGKLYPTQAQAARQGRAIYASGYAEGGIASIESERAEPTHEHATEPVVTPEEMPDWYMDLYNYLREKGSEGRTGQIAAILAGAGSGAHLGTMVPPYGIPVGALIGALLSAGVTEADRRYRETASEESGFRTKPLLDRPIELKGLGDLIQQLLNEPIEMPEDHRQGGRVRLI